MKTTNQVSSNKCSKWKKRPQHTARSRVMDPHLSKQTNSLTPIRWVPQLPDQNQSRAHKQQEHINFQGGWTDAYTGSEKSETERVQKQRREIIRSEEEMWSWARSTRGSGSLSQPPSPTVVAVCDWKTGGLPLLCSSESCLQIERERERVLTARRLEETSSFRRPDLDRLARLLHVSAFLFYFLILTIHFYLIKFKF